MGLARRVALTTSILAVVASAFSLARAAGGGTKQYVAGFVGDFETFCDDETGGEQVGKGIGGVCYRNIAATGTVHVEIQDDVFGSQVGYWTSFVDEDGNCIGETTDGDCPNLKPHCGTTTVAIPAGSVDLYILNDGFLDGFDDCNAPPGATTSGSITATFST